MGFFCKNVPGLTVVVGFNTDVIGLKMLFSCKKMEELEYINRQPRPGTFLSPWESCDRLSTGSIINKTANFSSSTLGTFLILTFIQKERMNTEFENIRGRPHRVQKIAASRYLRIRFKGAKWIV